MTPRARAFVSLRWRLLLPTALVVLVVAAFGVFFVATVLTYNSVDLSERIARQTIDVALGQVQGYFTSLRTEAARVAYTRGVDDALQTRDTSQLQPILASLMTLAQVDILMLVTEDGSELITLRRGLDGQISSSVNAALQDEPAFQRLRSGSAAEAIILRTPDGLRMMAGVPVVNGETMIGAVFAGQPIDSFIATLNASSVTQVAVYGADGSLLATSLDLTTQNIADLTISPATHQQALAGAAVSTNQMIAGEQHRAVVAPLMLGRTTLGTFSVSVPESFAASGGDNRPMVAGLAAAIAAGAVITLMVGVQRASTRLETVAETAYAIAAGHSQARTKMAPVDEIGRVGHAVDVMARAAQYREDQLRDMLSRERRERAYVFSVLEALPEGVLVYDTRGQLLMLNDHARLLLADQPLALPLVESARGAMLAKGIYTLGNPLQIERGEKVLQAQVAELSARGGTVLGRVVLLRDMTEEVRKQRMHTYLLEQMQEEVEQPLYETVASRSLRPDPVVIEFAREISRHAAALQKMIVDMQELTQYARPQARTRQRMIAVETLLWAVANDWRQIAIAANLTLQVTVQRKGLLVLGDESRLRLALGNLVDNAIKYTPAGGAITLEIERETDTDVHLRVRDNGVGIHDQDLKHLFVPFYRGTPIDEGGQILRVPGMGQGLAVARQIIDAHGGKIKVKSRSGAGTAVYLSLPLTAGIGQLPLGEPFLHESDTVVISVPNTMLP